MGACCSRAVVLPAVSTGPKAGVELTADELVELITQQTKLKSSRVMVADKKYFTYTMAELKEFVASDNTDTYKYIPEQFDCDDFSLVLAGREKLWSNRVIKQRIRGRCGSAFGICWGDIRMDEASVVPYPHAVCCFVDITGVFWLIEPQADLIYRPTANSTFWFVWM